MSLYDGYLWTQAPWFNNTPSERISYLNEKFINNNNDFIDHYLINNNGNEYKERKFPVHFNGNHMVLFNEQWYSIRISLSMKYDAIQLWFNRSTKLVDIWFIMDINFNKD